MIFGKAQFWFLGALAWWLCGLYPPLAAQTPYLNYEMVSGATVVAADPAFNGQSFNQRSTLGSLFAPVINNNDYMVGPGITFAQTTTEWANGFTPDKAYDERGYTTLSLFAVQRGKERVVQGFVVYAQRRDLAFTFPHPLHEVTLGGAIKHGLVNGLFPSIQPGRLTLGVILRRFPGTQRIIPYFSQRFTIGNNEILVEYPGTVSYTYKEVPTNERYRLATIVDDVPLTPRTTDDRTKIWGVDSYRISLVGIYEKQILAPVVLSASGGAIMEYIRDFDLNGNVWRKYTTAPAPYFRIGATAWL